MSFELKYKNQVIDSTIEYNLGDITYHDNNWKAVVDAGVHLHAYIPVDKITVVHTLPDLYTFEIKFVDGRKWNQTWNKAIRGHEDPQLAVNVSTSLFFLSEIVIVQQFRTQMLSLCHAHQILTLTFKFY